MIKKIWKKKKKSFSFDEKEMNLKFFSYKELSDVWGTLAN